ncbi:MAG: DNA polymerase III subunit beta [bacterium]
MEIICERDKFVEAIGVVQSAVSQRSPMPILSNVLIKAGDGTIDLIGTDLDIYIWKKTEGEITDSGSITVPSKKLAEIVRGLPSGSKLNMKTEGLSLSIECERAKFRLQGINADEYPVFPKIDSAVEIDIEGGLIKQMIRETVFAVSEDETKYALNGICFQIEGKTLVLVATDGFMLAYKQTEIKESIEGIVDLIVPTRASVELTKIIEEDEGVKISFGEKYVLWQMRQGSLASRIVEGKFPNYRSAIPDKFNYKMVIDRDIFFKKISLVSMIADERTNQILLNISPNLMEIKAESPEMGEGKDEMEIEYDGGSFTVAYNANLLKEVIKSFTEDKLVYELVDPIRHGKFYPPGNDDHFCIIMPMKV